METQSDSRDVIAYVNSLSLAGAHHRDEPVDSCPVDEYPSETAPGREILFADKEGIHKRSITEVTDEEIKFEALTWNSDVDDPIPPSVVGAWPPEPDEGTITWMYCEAEETLDRPSCGAFELDCGRYETLPGDDDPTRILEKPCPECDAAMTNNGDWVCEDCGETVESNRDRLKKFLTAKREPRLYMARRECPVCHEIAVSAYLRKRLSCGNCKQLWLEDYFDEWWAYGEWLDGDESVRVVEETYEWLDEDDEGGDR